MTFSDCYNTCPLQGTHKYLEIWPPHHESPFWRPWCWTPPLTCGCMVWNQQLWMTLTEIAWRAGPFSTHVDCISFFVRTSSETNRPRSTGPSPLWSLDVQLPMPTIYSKRKHWKTFQLSSPVWFRAGLQWQVLSKEWGNNSPHRAGIHLLLPVMVSYFKIVFSVFGAILVENTSRRKEEDGNAIGEDRPEEEVRYKRWCQKSVMKIDWQ